MSFKWYENIDVDIGKGKINVTEIDVLAPWRKKNLIKSWAVIQTLVWKKKKINYGNGKKKNPISIFFSQKVRLTILWMSFQSHKYK